MSIQQANREPQLFTLTLLASFGSVGATLFTPGLPLIAQAFQISAAAAQLTITLFLIGYAIGQLIYGPLSKLFLFFSSIWNIFINFEHAPCY